MRQHLWEVTHSYYCNLGNYFSNDCSQTYDSWAEFIEEEGDDDLDMNMIFRWDWKEPFLFTGDTSAKNGKLYLFYIGQRKGIYRYVEITVCRADEPAIIAFLQPRFQYLLNLWSPFMGENNHA